uniref:Opsin M6 n=1 Tax=Neogonodactylus oerstedii TaxID=85128 RepID=A0A6H0X1K7_NEOOE|nr:opsin M6 [Neogonodactylus oerstedii]
MLPPAAMTNNSLVMALPYRDSQPHSFGYPEGVTLKDFVREEINDLVHPHWYNFPPVNPMWHYLLGTVYIILFTISFVGNSVVINLFFKSKSLRTPANMLVVNVAVSDLLMTLSNYPMFIYNCFHGGVWMFSAFWCSMYGALAGVTGVCTIWSLAMISYDRYNIICNSFNGPKLTKGKALLCISWCWTMALLWNGLPFFGWGNYTLEGILDSCSFDYLSTDFNNTSYTLTIFVFDYCIPLAIVVGAYFFIVRAIFAHEKSMRDQAKKMNVSKLRSNEVEAQRAEIRITKTAIMNVMLWVCCWTPYATIAVKGVLGDRSDITPLVTILPALLAKSLSCFNPFVYAISHPKYRQAITEHMPWFCVYEPDTSKPEDNRSTVTSTKDDKA